MVEITMEQQKQCNENTSLILCNRKLLGRVTIKQQIDVPVFKRNYASVEPLAQERNHTAKKKKKRMIKQIWSFD
jgi:hypothetical protein